MVKRIPREDRGTCGLCDDGAKIIWIRSDQSPKGLFKTLIHELLHAVEAEYGLRIKHEMIYSLETALADLILDNT